MTNTGFIMLNRNLVNWEWYTEVNTSKVFLHCLLKVNYSAKRWQGVLIQKGEFVTSIERLAIETGLTISKVRTALSKLESTKDIYIETTTTFTKIGVLKLKEYVAESNREQNDTPNDTPLANDSQSNDNHLATTNTNNNIKNRIKIFREKVFTHSNFNIKILEDFFAYWSELDTNGKKMRFEKPAFFLRLKSALKNGLPMKDQKTKLIILKLKY